MFEIKEKKFEDESPEVQVVSTKKPSTSSHQYFEDAIYGDQEVNCDQTIASEIRRYLTELPERRETHVLGYWKAHQDVFPALARMAKTYLAIPATSSPSEGVFSKTKNILGPQRASLTSMNVEVLLCLKDWYRHFGPLFVID